MSLLPTRYGPRAAIRPLGLVQPHLRLGDLGFLGPHHRRIATWIGHGLTVVSGHAGSGKGRIMGALLGRHDLARTVAIAIAEDSFVESDEVGQIQVSHRLPRAQALLSALRQDPDLVLLLDVHGMPDRDTADACFRALGEGKQVLASMAATTAADVIEDLLDLGITGKQLGKHLRGILCSRLVRRVCPQCAETYRPAPAVLDGVGLTGDERDGPFVRGVGCAHCQQRGHLGRSLIYDCFEPSTAFWDELAGADREATILPVAERHGLITMRAVALHKVAQGLLDIADLGETLPSIYLPAEAGQGGPPPTARDPE